MATSLRALKPAFFDGDGNRRSGTGEHVVVLRPLKSQDQTNLRLHTDALLEVYVRQREDRQWSQLHVQPLTRPSGGRE